MIGQQIRILIVDDHAMVRKGIRLLLDGMDGLCVIGEAPNGLRAIEFAERLEPDVILMDLEMPVMDGIQAIRRIVEIRPEQHIIVLSGYVEDERLLQAIAAGAQGYVGKTTSTDDLVQSIRDVCSGTPALDAKIAWRILHGSGGGSRPAQQDQEHLTDREVDVLRLLTQGKQDKEIAQELVLEAVTIRTHVSRIISKLHVENRVQAALQGLRMGLVHLDELDTINKFAE